MASTLVSKSSMSTFSLMLIFFVSGALGGITCESLNWSTCSYAVSSAGTRCVLEKRLRRGSGQEKFICRSSAIEAGELRDWVETDECIEACGVNRDSLGISSDFLLESHFMRKNLCSSRCYQGCPNIADLYFNLAAAEGVFLPKLCEAQKANRRSMAQIMSCSEVALASGPTSSALEKLVASAPTQFTELLAVAPAPF